MRIRRRVGLLFSCRDGRTLDIAQLLSGSLTTLPQTQLYAISPAGGAEHRIGRDELDLLLSLPSNDWADADGHPPGVVGGLVERGLLVAEGEEPFDERLAESGWNRHAAVYHFMTRWRDVDVRDDEGDVVPASEEHVRAFLDLNGAPPPAFRPVETPEGIVDLPVVPADGELYSVLARRRTTRGFDGSRPLPVEELALALDQVFGVRGHMEVGDGWESLKRTSPSAGGLHPIDAWPLVLNVAGVEPGFHHYDARLHALEPVEPLARAAARELAARFVCGQTYFASAHVLLVLVARFARNYWKYRGHPKAYASILLDAGHLSQTLYLVATERGLGAFVTTVVNNAEIDERLGLDGVDEGALAICGLGVPGARTPFDPEFLPFQRR